MTFHEFYIKHKGYNEHEAIDGRIGRSSDYWLMKKTWNAAIDSATYQIDDGILIEDILLLKAERTEWDELHDNQITKK